RRRRTRRCRPRSPRERARRTVGPERRRQVDAREDRLRPRSPDIGTRGGLREARAAMGYLAELFRFPGWMTADELLELHQRLAGSRGGERERVELLELVGLEEAQALGRGDV